jgi:imidazolonepropionase-like amidohydrolase
MDGDRYGYTDIVDGPAECRKGVRKRLREGADVIKLLTTGGVVSREDGPDQPHFSAAEVETIVEEADRFDVPVACHAQGGEGVRLGLESGVHSIEHGFRLEDDVVDDLRSAGAVLVPTMTLVERLVEHGPEYGLADYAQKKASETYEDHIRSIQRAHEAGVPIAMGTDLNGTPLLPHGINLREFELYVEEVGMTPMESIQAGTSVAARAIDDDSIGALVPGRTADFVLTADDPLEDISGLRGIDVVYKGGRRVSDTRE